jgi:hypothetical protein
MKVKAIKAGGFIYGKVRKIGDEFELVTVNGRKPQDQFSSVWMQEIKQPVKKRAKPVKKAQA